MQQIETVTVQGSPMEVFLFPPPGTGPFPGLVLAMHIPGHTGIEHDTFTLEAARRFAANGYYVAVPFIFHWWPKTDTMDIKRQQSRDDWMVADLAAAFELLAGKTGVVRDRIAIAGHCWGGRVAWLGACHNPDYKACAVFYGGRIKLPMGADSTPPIELADRIRCPVVGFFGNDDGNPPPADVDDYDAALSAAGVEHHFYRYDGAGHAFQNLASPDHYREQASEDAWDKVLAFLAARLQ